MLHFSSFLLHCWDLTRKGNAWGQGTTRFWSLGAEEHRKFVKEQEETRMHVHVTMRWIVRIDLWILYEISCYFAHIWAWIREIQFWKRNCGSEWKDFRFKHKQQQKKNQILKQRRRGRTPVGAAALGSSLVRRYQSLPASAGVRQRLPSAGQVPRLQGQQQGVSGSSNSWLLLGYIYIYIFLNYRFCLILFFVNFVLFICLNVCDG